MESYKYTHPFNEFKILSAYGRIKQILQGELPFPQTLELYISNRCNHKCKGCHSKEFFGLKSPFMEIQLFKEIIGQLSSLGLEGIDFSGGGEPLLHPDFNAMIEFVVKKGVKAGLVTNGIFINRKSDKMLIENLSFIRLALDAANKKTYKRIHGYDDFPLLIENIRHLIKQKRKFNSCITIGLKFLISKMNYSEIFPAAQFAKSLGVDYVQFKLLKGSAKYNLSDSIQKEIDASLQKTSLLSTKEFFVVGSIKQAGRMRASCKLSLLHPAIDVSGNLYICNYFHHRKRAHRIGNLNRNSFEEIWLSKSHKEAIKNIKKVECNLFDCGFQKYAKIVNEAMGKNKMHLEFI